MTQVDTARADLPEIGSRRAIGDGSGPGRRRRGLGLAALALLLGLVIALHAHIPNRIGNVGSLAETFLPWSGLAIPALLVGALWRRSAITLAALLVPVVAWANLFGGQFVGNADTGGDLVVAEHNVGAGNPDPAGTARDLATSGADVLALVEVAEQARDVYERGLAKAYPFHTMQGTVGLWSKLPLSDIQPVDTRQDAGPLGDAKPIEEKLAYLRALRATVATDRGPLAVYVAHLGSVRVHPVTGFDTDSRDSGAQALAEAVAAEQNTRVVLLGDLNGTMDDRAFAGLTAQLRSAQEAAGDGFGFSWPAGFPVVRIDQILVRGVTTESSWVLPATGSDHLPIAAGISW
ncbi:MAG: hypothetical protein HOV79_15025 [Hamadaea sp.]|nr:hypothetical protein [Hamadaea sp.]